MALKRKGCVNPYTGETIEAYCVIDKVVNDKAHGACVFTVDFYNRQCSAQERASKALLPFESKPVTIQGTLWAQYFTPAVIAAAGTDEYAQAYLCLKRPVPVPDGAGGETEGNPWADPSITTDC